MDARAADIPTAHNLRLVRGARFPKAYQLSDWGGSPGGREGVLVEGDCGNALEGYPGHVLQAEYRGK